MNRRAFLASLLAAALAFGLNFRTALQPPLAPANGSALVPETGTPLPLRQRLGVNVVYANAPLDIARVAGWVRDYHRWYWYEPERGHLTWESGKQQVDRFYDELNSLGVQVLVNVGMVPAWYSSDGTTRGLPFPKGASGSSPADYLAHAEYLGQLAARYGATRHESGLRSADGRSGLGWVQAIEGWNEPNQSWADPRFPPSLFAQMLEADYDGEGAASGPASTVVGVKRGDPKMLSVLPGLAGPDVRYMDETMAWRRGGRLPFDVLSFHWFAKGDAARGGKAPEGAGLVAALAALRHWRDARAPGMPIWLTEVGWDTGSRAKGTQSSLYAPEVTAASYLVRTILIALANGADKLFVFTYRDDDSTSGEEYRTAGVVENTSAWEGQDARKKAAWYYLATINSVLGQMIMRSAEQQGEGHPSVYLYRLSVPDGSSGAAVAWVRNPNVDRDDGTVLPGYFLALPDAARAELVQLEVGSTTGKTSKLELHRTGLTSPGVELQLSETPVVVLYWRE